MVVDKSGGIKIKGGSDRFGVHTLPKLSCYTQLTFSFKPVYDYQRNDQNQDLIFPYKQIDYFWSSEVLVISGSIPLGVRA